MKNLLKCLMAMTGLVLISYSCSEHLTADVKEDPIEITDNELVPIEMTRETKAFVKDGNKFAFKLLEKVASQEEGSFMISPLSLTLTFGMVLEAEGKEEIRKEVCDVLGFGEGSSKEIQEYCTTMLSRLPEMDKLSKVKLANMVLTNSDKGKIYPPFEKSLTEAYGAFVSNQSFSDRDQIVRLVNNWAESNTEGMIKTPMGRDDIKESTSAILANALYFDGKWRSRFKQSDTKKEKFVQEDGTALTLDMMKQNADFSFKSFHEKDGPGSMNGGILRLPYGNGPL